jgi:hypothetical protein
LESVRERLLDFVEDKVKNLPEVEQEQLPYSYAGATQSKIAIQMNPYGKTLFLQMRLVGYS